MNFTIMQKKQLIREEQKLIRKKNFYKLNKISQKIKKFTTKIILTSSKKFPIIALYNAIKDELSLSVLFNELLKKNIKIVLPVVINKYSSLIFRQWKIGSSMSKDLFNISIPSDISSDLIPDIILLPLLAFDRNGGRLGYGGGFYDRTLANLRDDIISIGVGFSNQEIQKVPMNLYDKRLKYILTENELLVI